MNIEQNSPSSDRYKLRVAEYLASPRGRSASGSVAGKLLALDPQSIGMPTEPSMARLHATRAFFDALASDFDVREDDAPDARPRCVDQTIVSIAGGLASSNDQSPQPVVDAPLTLETVCATLDQLRDAHEDDGEVHGTDIKERIDSEARDLIAGSMVMLGMARGISWQKFASLYEAAAENLPGEPDVETLLANAAMRSVLQVIKSPAYASFNDRQIDAVQTASTDTEDCHDKVPGMRVWSEVNFALSYLYSIADSYSSDDVLLARNVACGAREITNALTGIDAALGDQFIDELRALAIGDQDLTPAELTTEGALTVLTELQRAYSGSVIDHDALDRLVSRGGRCLIAQQLARHACERGHSPWSVWACLSAGARAVGQNGRCSAQAHLGRRQIESLIDFVRLSPAFVGYSEFEREAVLDSLLVVGGEAIKDEDERLCLEAWKCMADTAYRLRACELSHAHLLTNSASDGAYDVAIALCNIDVALADRLISDLTLLSRDECPATRDVVAVHTQATDSLRLTAEQALHATREAVRIVAGEPDGGVEALQEIERTGGLALLVSHEGYAATERAGARELVRALRDFFLPWAMADLRIGEVVQALAVLSAVIDDHGTERIEEIGGWFSWDDADPTWVQVCLRYLTSIARASVTDADFKLRLGNDLMTVTGSLMEGRGEAGVRLLVETLQSVGRVHQPVERVESKNARHAA